MNSITDRIRVADLIKEAGGNYAEAARRIGYTRARVQQWVAEGREYLPELAQYRYASTGQRSSAANSE